MNTGNFDQDSHINGGVYTRYFGKDLTNLENQQFHVRDGSHPMKSTLKSSGREIKGKPNTKPTPLQFYKDIFKNQRLLHKRSQTNDANRSGSIELQELNRSKGMQEVKEPLQIIPIGANPKTQLTKFLKVKTRIPTGNHSELRQDNQIVIQEFQNEKNNDTNFTFKSSKDPKLENYSGKFSSIPSLIPAALQQSKLIGISRQTPTGQYHSSKFQNSDFQKQEKPRPDRSNKNFQYLRLNLEEEQKSSPRRVPQRESMDKESAKKSDSKEEMDNELEESHPIDARTLLFQQFDIPFMWEYLLFQEVISSNLEKHV